MQFEDEKPAQVLAQDSHEDDLFDRINFSEDDASRYDNKKGKIFEEIEDHDVKPSWNQDRHYKAQDQSIIQQYHLIRDQNQYEERKGQIYDGKNLQHN